MSRITVLRFIRSHLATSIDQPPERSFSCAVALTISAQFGIDISGGVQQPGVLTMPGNPEECRRHALECVRLAQATSIPQRREYFAKLAATWIELAEELERSRELLDEELDEPHKRTG